MLRWGDNKESWDPDDLIGQLDQYHRQPTSDYSLSEGKELFVV